MCADQAEQSKWKIHGERLVDDTRRLRLSIASVELPSGVHFEQYVLRLPRAAMMVVLDDQDQVLMIWRHRFVLDRWVWELPGGYVDPGEDPAEAARREVAEETGWQPRESRLLLTSQPMVGTAEAENLVFFSRGADRVGDPQDTDEAHRISWLPLSSVAQRIGAGEIVGSASQLGLLQVLAFPPN
jgi:8-oxo-dGTP pyrophosphatase MutT (NUDIX family)